MYSGDYGRHKGEACLAPTFMVMVLIYELIVLAFLLALLGIVLVNLWVLPRLQAYAPLRGEVVPGVAILVPARNEEERIEACLRSLLGQDYPNFEVWLYDDGSTDRTGEIADGLASADRRLHVVSGKAEPPPGWLGKAHACSRLFEEVRARSAPDYLLFTDADVRFAPGAVSHAVAAARALDAGLLSAFPRQITVSWAERFAVPMLLHWAVYSFLPLPLAHSRRTGSAFAAANGQIMLFTREAYEACGGHSAVRSQILEDVGLARAVKGAGCRTVLADSGPFILTRMYDGPGEVWRGYSKNAYAFFGYSPLFLGVGIVMLLALYTSPVALAAWFLLSGQATGLYLPFAMYILGVGARLALALRFRYRSADVWLHPVAVLFLIAICINSMVWSLTGRGAWKGRASAATAPTGGVDQSTPTTRTRV